MPRNRKMLNESHKEGDNISKQMHPDRRQNAQSQQIEKRTHPNRTQVWIKNSVIAYEEELRNLQIELLKLQNHIKAQGLKVLIIFEGRDAAGKGGAIKRFIEHLNPRGARVVALNKPSDIEKSQWYFQRYVQHLPSAGEMVFFDRSWYNRAGVEPVMHFCSPKEHQEFLNHVPLFEKMLTDSGIILFKFWFSVSKKAQAKRFKMRLEDPLKQYKLSPVDMQSQELWDAYSDAKLQMLKASHTPHAPWTIVRSDDKRSARLNAIKHLLKHIPYPDAISNHQIDKKVLHSGDKEIKIMEHLDG